MFKKLLKKQKAKTDVAKDLEKFNEELIAKNQKLLDSIRNMQH